MCVMVRVAHMYIYVWCACVCAGVPMCGRMVLRLDIYMHVHVCGMLRIYVYVVCRVYVCGWSHVCMFWIYMPQTVLSSSRLNLHPHLLEPTWAHLNLPAQNTCSFLILQLNDHTQIFICLPLPITTWHIPCSPPPYLTLKQPLGRLPTILAFPTPILQFIHRRLRMQHRVKQLLNILQRLLNLGF